MAKIVVTKIRENFYSAQTSGFMGVGHNKARALRRLLKAVEAKETEAQRAVNKLARVADKLEDMALRAEMGIGRN